jgi:hypothetical protein
MQPTTIYDDKDISNAFGKFFEKRQGNLCLDEIPISRNNKDNGDSKKKLINCNIL